MTTKISASTELLTKSLKAHRSRDAKEKRKAGLLRNRRGRVACEEVFPNLPKSLTTHFFLDEVSLEYTIYLTFKAIKDFSTSAQRTRRALGTITKSVQTLKRGGWFVGEEPSAKVRDKSLAVSLVASKLVRGKFYTLNIYFEGFDDTPKCHLVKKQVIIEAVYTPERIEERLVIECDDDEEMEEEKEE